MATETPPDSKPAPKVDPEALERERAEMKKELGELTEQSQYNFMELIDSKATEKIIAFYSPDKPETAKNKEAALKIFAMYAVEYGVPPQDALDSIYGKNKVPFEVKEIVPGEPWQVSLANMGVTKEVIVSMEYYVREDRSVKNQIENTVEKAKNLEKVIGSLHVLSQMDLLFGVHNSDWPTWIVGMRKLGIPTQSLVHMSPSNRTDMEQRGFLDHVTQPEPMSVTRDLEYLGQLKELGVEFNNNTLSFIGSGLNAWANSDDKYHRWPPINYLRKVQSAGMDITQNLMPAFELYHNMSETQLPDEIQATVLTSLKSLHDKGFQWDKLDMSFLVPREGFSNTVGEKMGKSMIARIILQPDFLPSLKSKGGKEEDLNILLKITAARNVMVTDLGEFTANENDFDFFNFLSDPAMPHILGAMKFMTAAQKNSELPMFVGRFLATESKEPTAQTVKEAVATLDQLIKSRSSVEILGKGRGVSVIAHDEKMTANNGDRVDRFGKAKFKSKIKEITGSEAKEFRLPREGEGTLREKLQKLKDDALEDIATAKPPHSFFQDGHGAYNSFALMAIPENDLQLRLELGDAYHITYTEFVQALNKRYENFKNNPIDLANLEKDAFIFSACINHNLVRTIDQELAVPYRPVFVSSGEFGQVSYSDFKSDAGNIMFDKAFKLDEKTPQAVTVGDVIRLQDFKNASTSVSNISVWVPYKGRSVQVGENESQKKEKKAA